MGILILANVYFFSIPVGPPICRSFRTQPFLSLNLPLLFVFNHKNQVNLVLDDAIEYTPDTNQKDKFVKAVLNTEILLNGNQIAVLVPGGTGPPDDAIVS